MNEKPLPPTVKSLVGEYIVARLAAKKAWPDLSVFGDTAKNTALKYAATARSDRYSDEADRIAGAIREECGSKNLSADKIMLDADRMVDENLKEEKAR